ncbi:MAG: electron transfer flavoprotein beta subunit/FixA family protein, partial [Muribaculaceae bacterium]
AAAVRHIKNYDIIIGGRQAIDGDTAQVGPQIAEKLGLPQVTYAEEIISVKDGKAIIKRRLESGVETVEAPLPLVITVNGTADACRPRNARFIQKFKYAVTPSEKATLNEEMTKIVDSRPFLNLYEWSATEVQAEPSQIGLAGSPTKVKSIENVVFQAKESKQIEGKDDVELENLIKELIINHTIG